MLNNYKTQPANAAAYGIKEIKQQHLVTFRYKDAKIETDKKGKKISSLPYKFNKLMELGGPGWTSGTIKLDIAYNDIERFEYVKRKYEASKS